MAQLIIRAVAKTVTVKCDMATAGYLDRIARNNSLDEMIVEALMNNLDVTIEKHAIARA